MPHSRLFLVPALCGLMSVPLLAPPAVAANASASGSCDANTYVISRSVSGYTSAPVITHASQHTVAAHSSLTVSQSAEMQTTVSAGLTISGDLSGEAAYGIGKISAHFGVSASKSGSKTSSKSVSVKVHVTNSSSHNRLYLAFSGVNRYRASMKVTVCVRDYASVGHTHTYTGALNTFGVASNGFLYCKGGGASAIGTLAIKLYCH